jgi:hypothetical protein
MVGMARMLCGRAREWPPRGGGEGGEYSLIAILAVRRGLFTVCYMMLYVACTILCSPPCTRTYS